jgi:hypothetical protein
MTFLSKANSEDAESISCQVIAFVYDLITVTSPIFPATGAGYSIELMTLSNDD